MILSLDFLPFTIHNHDSAKSMTQKHDPDVNFWLKVKNVT
jgi:hypothetical protein